MNAPRIKIAPRQKRIRVPLSLIHLLRDQLAAMNISATEAEVWVQPRSHATTYLIESIDAVLAEKQ